MAESAAPQPDVFSEELWKSLECPICLKYMTASIHLCVTGHGICSQCMKQDVKQCPLCKAEFGSGRNFIAEDLAKKVPFPCENKDYGCTVRVLGSELQQHQVTCLYRIRNCFVDVCKWMGRRSDLAKHFTDEHPDDTFPDGAGYNIPADNFSVEKEYSLMCAYEELFLWFVYPNPSKRNVASCVYYIGEAEKATQFTYTVTLNSDDGHRSLCYTDTTKNEPSNLDTLTESAELFVANEDVYKKFVDKDGKVYFHFKISKT